MTRREKAFTISGILVLLVTILLFFIITQDRTTITWLGFLFLIVAEVIFFGGMLLIENIASRSSQIVIRSGVGATITIYTILSIVVSLVYMNLLRDSIVSLCVIQILLFSVAAILCVIFYTSGKGVKAKEDKVDESSAKIDAMINRMKLLKSNKEYNGDLEKVCENLRFSDTSTFVEVDKEIEDKIGELESAFLKDDENKDTEIKLLIKEISSLINKRKVQVKELKKGNI